MWCCHCHHQQQLPQLVLLPLVTHSSTNNSYPDPSPSHPLLLIKMLELPQLLLLLVPPQAPAHTRGQAQTGLNSRQRQVLVMACCCLCLLQVSFHISSSKQLASSNNPTGGLNQVQHQQHTSRHRHQQVGTSSNNQHAGALLVLGLPLLLSSPQAGRHRHSQGHTQRARCEGRHPQHQLALQLPPWTVLQPLLQLPRQQHPRGSTHRVRGGLTSRPRLLLPTAPTGRER